MTVLWVIPNSEFFFSPQRREEIELSFWCRWILFLPWCCAAFGELLLPWSCSLVGCFAFCRGPELCRGVGFPIQPSKLGFQVPILALACELSSDNSFVAFCDPPVNLICRSFYSIFKFNYINIESKRCWKWLCVWLDSARSANKAYPW